ncbi:uncharacterized protein LOC123986169 [Micropterus dolomieu]|uniref:uncharacterized protein LOC123986169 n=1 Tax=Micropterus dolomieu TaxID=147949 RepID=UPI001E8EE53A|nr:uncharacterized protein LOC123986169 [Micropterus dolomieu]
MRYAPAQQAQDNRLMYTLIKLLWLRSPQGSCSGPEKSAILRAYRRVQHRITVEDPVLCKAGVPLQRITIKTVQDFIRRQERLLKLHATKQPSTRTKIASISSADLPPAPHQPAVLPPPLYLQIGYLHAPSTAGTKVLKGRTDISMPLTQPQPPLPPVLLPVREIPAASTITRPVPSLSASTASPRIAGPSTRPIRPATSARPIRPATSKLSQVQKLPVCTLCGQPTQGHKKYKKKDFVPNKNDVDIKRSGQESVR